MNFCKNSCLLAGLAIAALGVGAALSQERGDPIGAVTQVGIFDRAQQVKVGKAKTGKPVCYFREQGSRHSVDIGVAADGAFIRLETGDSRETTPQPPLRVFAGKQTAKGEYATNDFATLQEYKGAIAFYVPKPSQGDFVIVAKGEAKALLEMVARARTEFVVVQSVAQPQNVDVVAIYNFKAAAIPALLACAKARIQVSPAQIDRATSAQMDIVKFFDNGNIDAVRNRPTRTTVFTVSEPTRVTRIATYHWNDGLGATPGRIALRNRSGETFGFWQAGRCSERVLGGRAGCRACCRKLHDCRFQSVDLGTERGHGRCRHGKR